MKIIQELGRRTERENRIFRERKGQGEKDEIKRERKTISVVTLSPQAVYTIRTMTLMEDLEENVPVSTC